LQRVYAKFRLFIILFSAALLLTGCGGYTGGEPNTGIVTKDPDSIPNIGWQTQGQRSTLPSEAAAPQTGEAPAPVKPRLTVSLLVPLTGDKAALGQSMLNAAQMALFDIGADNLSLVPRDTQSTPDGAVKAAEAAIAAHSALILGPVFSADLKAVKPVAAQANVPVISFTTDWTLAGNGSYVMGFLPFTQVLRVARYAQEHGHSRVAAMAPETEYADIVLRTLSRSGTSVSPAVRYPAGQLDVSSFAQELAQSAGGFDTLMLPVGSEGLNALVSAIGAAGVSQKSGLRFIGTGLWDDPALANNPALFGGWFSAPDPALRADFERRYLDNYQTPPQRLATLAYDATALAAVLARTATDEQSAYGTGALTNPRGFAGIDGIFRFRPDGLSERGLAVLELRSGKARVIDPAPTAFISSGS